MLLAVIAAVIAGAAFAPGRRDRAAARTLGMLLRLARLPAPPARCDRAGRARTIAIAASVPRGHRAPRRRRVRANPASLGRSPPPDPGPPSCQLVPAIRGATAARCPRNATSIQARAGLRPIYLECAHLDAPGRRF